MTDYLVDANVWLRSFEPEHPMFSPATLAIEAVLKNGNIFLVPQVIGEFWRVVTAPLDQQRGGLGWSIAQVDQIVKSLEDVYPLLPDNAQVYTLWRDLVVDFGVSGSKVHDARLVAAMLAHGLTHILTFNGKDFQRYTSTLGITIVHPDDATSKEIT